MDEQEKKRYCGLKVWGNPLQYLEAPHETPTNLVVKDVKTYKMSLVDQGFVGEVDTPITMSKGSQEKVETMIRLALEDPFSIPESKTLSIDVCNLKFHFDNTQYPGIIDYIDFILEKTKDNPRGTIEFPEWYGNCGAKVMGYAGAGINQFRRYTPRTINAPVIRNKYEKKRQGNREWEEKVGEEEVPIYAYFNRPRLIQFREYLSKFSNMTDNEIMKDMQGYHPEYLFQTLPEMIRQKNNWAMCGLINNGGYVGQVYMMWPKMLKLFTKLMPPKWYFWITSNLAEGNKVVVSSKGSTMPSGHCKSIYMDVFGNFIYGRIASHSARGPLAAPSLLYRNMFSKTFPLFSDIESQYQKKMLEFKGFMNNAGIFSDKLFTSVLKAAGRQAEGMANYVIDAANNGKLPLTEEAAKLIYTNPGRLANISGYVPEPMCEAPPRLYITPMEAIGESSRKRTAPRSDEPEPKRNLEKKGRTIIIKTNRFPGKKEDQSTVKK